MVHVSKRKLKPNIQSQILKQLALHMARLRGEKQTQYFLSEFLTEAEQLQLAKRLAVLILLMRGYSFTQIEKAIKVSPVTIAKTWKALKNGAYTTIEKESIFHGQSFQQDSVLEGLLKLLTEGLPPRAGKGRWNFLRGI